MAPQGVAGPVPGRKDQLGCGTFTDGPAKHELADVVVLREDLRPPPQELLHPQPDRIGVVAVLPGDLAGSLFAGERLQNKLELELRGLPLSGHG